MSAADDAASSVLGACDRPGVFNVSAELAGGGSVSAKALEAAEDGIDRLLQKLGVVINTSYKTAPAVNLYRRLPVAEAVYARSHGLFEPCVDIGDQVQSKQLAGRIHSIETPR
jgi:uncharacterized protein